MRSYIIIFVLIGTRTYLSRNSFRQQFSVIYAQTVAIARNNATDARRKSILLAQLTAQSFLQTEM